MIFINNSLNSERHPKEIKLISKAEKLVVRKKFASEIDLKHSVYASLIRYLEEHEFIRSTPWDATLNGSATQEDLSVEKIRAFITLAKSKRNFPFSIDSDIKNVLVHLNLMHNDKISNAAILLFGKNPQRFFLTSEIKCAHFHGIDITKPIPSYQVYKGSAFELIDQAVDFVLSKINVSVGIRSIGADVPVNYEIPRGAVSEAIINAVAHRDYTSNGSVQVMLFQDRLEIWNPGQLPYGLTPAKLLEPHSSIPANPLLAEPMYLAAYIERMGTGTGDIIKLCKEAGIRKTPEFIQEEHFKMIIWRNRVGDDTTDGTIDGTIDGTKDGTLDGTKDVTIDDVTKLRSDKERISIILRMIADNPEITIDDLASLTNHSRRTIKRDIKTLKEEGKIIRVGVPRFGTWRTNV